MLRFIINKLPWCRRSVTAKVLVVAVSAYLMSATAILLFAYLQLISILDRKQTEIFHNEVATVLKLTHKSCEELNRTGMQAAYRNEAQQELLAFLRNEHYGNQDGTSLESYPYIIDEGGLIVLHPVLKQGDASVKDSGFIQEALQSKNGSMDYVYHGEKKWMVYDTFEPWRWTICYAVPHRIKYADAHRLLTTLVPIVLVMVGLIVASIGNLLYRMVTRPLKETMTLLQEVAKGDLSKTASSYREDEIGMLACHFNNMVGGLKEIITHVQSTANQITDSGQNILSTSKTQNQSATEHSVAVEKTAEAAEHLSQNSDAIGENISIVTQMANHVLQGMEAIKTAAGQTSTILTSLNEKSQHIGQITGLINEIADKTNLLAVNAAIEAARAGEHGRGFTVVADQIGKLADSTSRSTKDISGLVDAIQDEMANAMAAMEQSLSSVDEEIQLTNESATRSQEISMNANQQIAGSRQIAEAMAGIEATMKDMIAGVESSTDAAQHLMHLADTLKDSMTRFKVN